MRKIILFICWTFSLSISAQKKNEAFQLPIHQAKSPIIIDGVLDELAWQDAAIADNFFMVLPMDTSRAQVKTEVRMAYDNDNIYIVATCFNSLQGGYTVESMRRDFNFGKNDNFICLLVKCF